MPSSHTFQRSHIFDRYKPYKIQLLTTVILFAVILLAPFSRGISQTLYPTNIFHAPSGTVGLDYDLYGTLTVTKETGAVTLASDTQYYPRGSYVFTIYLSGNEAGNTAAVPDSTANATDSTAAVLDSSGNVLASAALMTDETTVSLSFSIPASVEGIMIFVDAAGPLALEKISVTSMDAFSRDSLFFALIFLVLSLVVLLIRLRFSCSAAVPALLLFAVLWSSLPLCYGWLLSGTELAAYYTRLCTTEPFAWAIQQGLSLIGCYRLLVLALNLVTVLSVWSGIYYTFRSARLGVCAAFVCTLATPRLALLYQDADLKRIAILALLPLLLCVLRPLVLLSRKLFHRSGPAERVTITLSERFFSSRELLMLLLMGCIGLSLLTSVRWCSRYADSTETFTTWDEQIQTLMELQNS